MLFNWHCWLSSVALTLSQIKQTKNTMNDLKRGTSRWRVCGGLLLSLQIYFPHCSPPLFCTISATASQKLWLLCLRTLGSALSPKRPLLLGQAPGMCAVKILSNQQHQPKRLYRVQMWWLCRSLNSADSSDSMHCYTLDYYPEKEPVVWLRMFPDIWIYCLLMTLISSLPWNPSQTWSLRDVWAEELYICFLMQM